MKISTAIKTGSAIMLMSVSMFNNASAASFTAVASGNWSSAITWGGSAPSNNISSDQIHIASGINVSMDNDVTFNGALSSIDVNGTLSSSTDKTLTMENGSMTGNGSVTVDNVVFNSNAALTFTGSFAVKTMRMGMTSLLTTAHFMISDKMTMAGGVFTLQTLGNFDMGNNGTIEMAGGSFSSGGGTIGLAGNYNVVYTSGSSNTGSELSGSGLKNVTINSASGNTISLQSDMTVKGTLTMTSGEMKLNGHHMIINGDVASGGSGTIHSTNTSDITVNSSNAWTGALRFSDNGHTVRNFTINFGQASGMAMMGSNMAVAGTLHFMSGKMHTGDYNLDLGATGSITGSGNSSYVMTGTNGRLSMNINAGGTTAAMYPLGNGNYYTPGNVSLNSGSSSGSVGIGVAGDVLVQGTTGSSMSTTKAAVKNTWHVYSDMTSNIDMNLEVMWSSAMEVNGFNRSSSYISHYTSSNWDASATASATLQTSGMYSLKRNNITSLSPFAVFSGPATGIAEAGNDAEFAVYPNPAANVIMINAPHTGSMHVDIMNITGQVVSSQQISGADAISVENLKTGNYFIRMYNDQVNVTRKFNKL